MLAIFNIGPLEFVLLIAAAVMLFGGDLPDVMRKAGVLLGRVRRTTADLSRLINDAASEGKSSAPLDEIRSLRREIGPAPTIDEGQRADASGPAPAEDAAERPAGDEPSDGTADEPPSEADTDGPRPPRD